jgi:hypothetical protein
MGYDDSDLAIQSSWILASMLGSTDIVSLLDKIDTVNKKQKSLDWVWKPFDDTRASSMYIIANRISFILSKYINGQNAQIPTTIFHRLAIPIYIEIMVKTDPIDSKHLMIMEEDVRLKFMGVLQGESIPDAYMWQNATIAGGSYEYSYFTSLEFVYSCFLLTIPIASIPLFTLFWMSTNHENYLSLFFCATIVLFYLSYCLRGNYFLCKKWEISFAKGQLYEYGIMRKVEIPVYFIFFIFLFAMNFWDCKDFGTWIAILLLDICIFLSIWTVLTSIQEEKKSRNPLRELLMEVEGKRIT